MKKLLLYLIVVVISISIVVSFSLVGCKEEAAPAEGEEAAPAEGEEAAPAEGESEEEAVEVETVKDTLIYGISYTPSGVDIDIEGDIQSQDIIFAVYDGGTIQKYMERELDDGSTILFEDPNATGGSPALFTKWELKDRIITVELRKGVKSAWGNEFTTKDIEWMLERGVASKAIFYSCISMFGCDPDTEMGGFKIIDDYTFQMEQVVDYDLYLFDFIQYMGWYQPWDSTEAQKHATEEDPWASEWIGVNGGGFGPYYITEWSPDKQIVLEANPNYWGDPPKQFKKIIFQVIPESANRIAALKKGDIDIAGGLSYGELSELVGEPGLRVINYTSTDYEMAWPNRELNDAFKDPKVIQAINMAIPRDDIVELAYYGFAKPMEYPVPEYVGNGVTKKEDWPFKYDLEKAKQLLSETEYADNLEIEMTYDNAYSADETMCLLIKESLEKIGIKVNLLAQPSGVHDSMLRNRELEFTLYPNCTSTSKPLTPLLQWYGVDYYENYGNWDHPDFDRLVEEAGTMRDEEKIAESLEIIGNILLETPPVIYIAEIQKVFVGRDDLKGWNFTLGGSQNLNLLYLEE